MDNLNVPTVSIVFTSYNHKEFLGQAIDSLLAQTYQDFELIIVDDKSTDGSQDLILTYKDVPQVKLFLRDVNSGSYVKASNYGAEKALGKYLMFAQCDDFAEPNQLEELISAFKRDPGIGVSFSKSNLVDETGKVFDNDYRIREKSFREFCINNTVIPKDRMRIFLSKACVLPNLSAALINKEMYLKSGGLSEKYLVAADWAFWLSLAELCDFSYINSALNNFRQHKTTIRSTIKIKKQITEIYEIFYAHLYKYNITGTDKNSFRVGAGAVWLSFFGQGYKAWIFSFPGLIKETFWYEKLNLYYLVRGLFYKIKEFLIRSR